MVNTSFGENSLSNPLFLNSSASFNFLNFSSLLVTSLPNVSGLWLMSDGSLIIQVSDPYPVLKLLKSFQCFNYTLRDMWCSDFTDLDKRFQINYRLINLYNNHSITVRCYLKKPLIRSISSLWPSAIWCEREIWDMYGVIFTGNSDLRRILTDYSFRGHPLRKDFPLNGFLEVRYDDTEKLIVSEPIEIGQEYRNFQFRSPWSSVT